MRRRLAQILAVFTSLAILMLSALFAHVQQRGLPPAPAAAPIASTPEDAPAVAPAQADADEEDIPPVGRLVDRGRQVYQELRCSSCHSIAGSGNRRNPLDGVGSRLTRELLRRWIVDPRSIDPKVWKPSYENLSNTDLDALVEYLTVLTDSDDDRK
ncbi:MAG: c-type cytochrome [Phycisphaerales bacterium]|nr:c-type cytochrome [Phycisphaerales bacterium]